MFVWASAIPTKPPVSFWALIVVFVIEVLVIDTDPSALGSPTVVVALTSAAVTDAFTVGLALMRRRRCRRCRLPTAAALARAGWRGGRGDAVADRWGEDAQRDPSRAGQVLLAAGRADRARGDVDRQRLRTVRSLGGGAAEPAEIDGLRPDHVDDGAAEPGWYSIEGVTGVAEPLLVTSWKLSPIEVAGRDLDVRYGTRSRSRPG